MTQKLKITSEFSGIWPTLFIPKEQAFLFALLETARQSCKNKQQNLQTPD